MEPDGKWQALSSGMQIQRHDCGQNGNLIVCDMFGHRVVEVDPATGSVVRVLLDKIDGKPTRRPERPGDGREGGLYITDPQFTPETKKNQPGTQVYYLAPDGKARVVIRPASSRFPNGVEFRPTARRCMWTTAGAAARREFRLGLRRRCGRLAVEEAQFADELA